MSPKAQASVSYRWHLRMVMAERGMFSTTDLLPLLASRGVVLSREQVYRLVAKIPERLSLKTLAALCDALDCGPEALIEPISKKASPPPAKKASARGVIREIRPRRARITADTES